jgi:hypothetical protein
MKNFPKIVSVYVGVLFFLAQRACVAYIWLLFKYAFICIQNTGRHIRIITSLSPPLFIEVSVPSQES